MTAVIIGVGGIGSQIAQRAHGFGMKVIGVDPKDIAPPLGVSRIVTPDHLDEVVPQADVVFVSAPLTSQSRHHPRRQNRLRRALPFRAASLTAKPSAYPNQRIHRLPELRMLRAPWWCK